ncbi:MAG: hypothetical protein BWY59_00645 [Verrucomicrobia bacterium ADurb.Bin345]|nr:MAG: hypothetical protein BWY59_00645 [Verrucomicrobia bacterium ADurb.Bin345]
MRKKVTRVCALLSVGVALVALAAIPFILESRSNDALAVGHPSSTNENAQTSTAGE